MRTNDGEMVSKPNSFVTLIGVIFDRSSSDCYVRSLVGIVLTLYNQLIEVP